MPARPLYQFQRDAQAYLSELASELDSAFAEFAEKTRDFAPRLETGTKASIVRDLAARRMREFCDRTKGTQYIRRGNLGVVGLANNWVLRLKKVADGFKVAVSPTGASHAYNHNEVPLSLEGILLPDPPATCLYLAWAVPENAPHRIEKWVICNNAMGGVDWVLPLNDFSPGPAAELPLPTPPEFDPTERRVRVKTDRKRKANG